MHMAHVIVLADQPLCLLNTFLRAANSCAARQLDLNVELVAVNARGRPELLRSLCAAKQMAQRLVLKVPLVFRLLAQTVPTVKA